MRASGLVLTDYQPYAFLGALLAGSLGVTPLLGWMSFVDIPKGDWVDCRGDVAAAAGGLRQGGSPRRTAVLLHPKRHNF